MDDQFDLSTIQFLRPPYKSRHGEAMLNVDAVVQDIAFRQTTSAEIEVNDDGDNKVEIDVTTSDKSLVTIDQDVATITIADIDNMAISSDTAFVKTVPFQFCVRYSSHGCIPALISNVVTHLQTTITMKECSIQPPSLERTAQIDENDNDDDLTGREQEANLRELSAWRHQLMLSAQTESP